jgi:hypothetical protein
MAAEIATDDLRAHAANPSLSRGSAAGRRALVEQVLLEFRNAHACLQCAQILDIEPEDAGQLGQIIDIAARLDHAQHIAPRHCVALLGRQVVAPAITLLVGQERGAIGLLVKRKAHGIEFEAATGEFAVEQQRAGDPRRSAILSGLVIAASSLPARMLVIADQATTTP